MSVFNNSNGTFKASKATLAGDLVKKESTFFDSTKLGVNADAKALLHRRLYAFNSGLKDQLEAFLENECKCIEDDEDPLAKKFDDGMVAAIRKALAIVNNEVVRYAE